jgi:hypothetical protein
MSNRDLDVEKAWEFWAPIVMKDGVLDVEQVKKELTDWYYVMGQVPKVYCAVTGDLLSKVMYDADTVITAFEDYLTRQIDDAVQERMKSLREIVDAQAADAGLWAVYIDKLQPISEAHLQQELRRLHAAVELAS